MDDEDFVRAPAGAADEVSGLDELRAHEQALREAEEAADVVA